LACGGSFLLRFSALGLFLAAACARPRTATPPDSMEWVCMGTIAAVSVPAGQSGRLPGLRETVAERLASVERDLSVFRADSVLNAVNAAAGTRELVPVNAHAAAVLAHALQVAEASGGAFDPTVGPLMALWGFRGLPVADPPTGEAIAEVLEHVGWRHIRLDTSVPEAPSAALARPGMRLDLGGVAKGYAVDLAYDRLRAAGETDFLVNLGGNLRGCGLPGAGRDGWRVGVRDPFNREGILGAVTLREGEAAATSGNYERFVILRGVRYAHILDPRSGRPVTGVAGVTVLAPTAMQADALSTALFVLGPADGLRLLAAQPGCHALWVLDEEPLRTIASPGFSARFRPAHASRAGRGQPAAESVRHPTAGAATL